MAVAATVAVASVVRSAWGIFDWYLRTRLPVHMISDVTDIHKPTAAVVWYVFFLAFWRGCTQQHAPLFNSILTKGCHFGDIKRPIGMFSLQLFYILPCTRYCSMLCATNQFFSVMPTRIRIWIQLCSTAPIQWVYYLQKHKSTSNTCQNGVFDGEMVNMYVCMCCVELQ